MCCALLKGKVHRGKTPCPFLSPFTFKEWEKSHLYLAPSPRNDKTKFLGHGFDGIYHLRKLADECHAHAEQRYFSQYVL